MAPILSRLLALGALASMAFAKHGEDYGYPKQPMPSPPPSPSSPPPLTYINNTLFVYLKSGCRGSAFVFENLDHSTCALSSTRPDLNISQAIAAGATQVHSAFLVFENVNDKTIQANLNAWNPGPKNNTDGPLQCGTAAKTRHVTPNDPTCLSADHQKYFTGYSYDLLSGDDTSGNIQSRDDGGQPAPCKAQQLASSVMIGGDKYKYQGIPSDDAKAFANLLFSGKTDVPENLKKYAV